MKGRMWIVAAMAGGLLSLWAPSVFAQAGVGVAGCPEGAEPRGWIGIASIECSNCQLTSTESERIWNFSSEPVVRAVSPGSPADGRIREGDEVVAVDGHLITTGEGGRRLANLEPGRDVSIVVRSGNRERTVRLVPEGQCPRLSTAPAAPTPDAAPEPPAVPDAEPVVSAGVAVGVPREAVTAPAAPAPATGVAVAVGPVPRPTYTLLPSGWFGFGIQCTNCRWSVDEETGKSEWEFSSPPEISSVEEGSPAAAAGLRRGDVLLEIDGEALIDREGPRRFGSVKPGETVRWTYVRAGETRTTTATAAERPGLPPVPDAAPRAYAGQLARAYVDRGGDRLRYSGLVGDASVEVRGAGSVVVNIIEPGREIEIVTSDSRTRIRLDKE